MNSNRLIDGFKTKNIYNNPIINDKIGVISNPEFMQRMQFIKSNQLQKINNIESLHMPKEKIVELIINPIKDEKTDTKTAVKEYQKLEITYPKSNVSNQLPDQLVRWYSGRNNMPYKNILKNEDYTKKITDFRDLIVHKVNTLDKDTSRFTTELKKLINVLEKHNNELKIIFSNSEETKHKQAFEYINKYKYKISYNPKQNQAELKKLYKKEVADIENNINHIDEMISMLLESDDPDKKEFGKIYKEFNDNLPKSQNNNIDDIKINNKFDNGKSNEKSDNKSEEESDDEESDDEESDDEESNDEESDDEESDDEESEEESDNNKSNNKMFKIRRVVKKI